MNIFVKVSAIVLKPIDQVYDSIINKEKMSGYFITRADNDMEEGKTISWEWDDVGVKLDVELTKLETNKCICFKWKASGKPSSVEITLEHDGHEKTRLSISDGPYQLNEEEIPLAMQQNQGWTDFICSLKAYLHTGINLRNGRYSN